MNWKEEDPSENSLKVIGGSFCMAHLLQANHTLDFSPLVWSVDNSMRLPVGGRDDSWCASLPRGEPGCLLPVSVTTRASSSFSSKEKFDPLRRIQSWAFQEFRPEISAIQLPCLATLKHGYKLFWDRVCVDHTHTRTHTHLITSTWCSEFPNFHSQPPPVRFLFFAFVSRCALDCWDPLSDTVLKTWRVFS